MSDFIDMRSFREAEMPPGRDPVQALLLDDDSDDTFIMRSLTAKSKQIDISLRASRSVEDARTALAERRFDILFVDYWLGTETSIAFIHDLTQVSDTPCILVTTLDTPEIRRCAFRAGVAGFLSKDDLSIQAIESVILTVLHRSGRIC